MENRSTNCFSKWNNEHILCVLRIGWPLPNVIWWESTISKLTDRHCASKKNTTHINNVDGEVAKTRWNYINSWRGGGKYKTCRTQNIYHTIEFGKSVRRVKKNTDHKRAKHIVQFDWMSAKSVPRSAQSGWFSHSSSVIGTTTLAQTNRVVHKRLCNIVFWRKNPSNFNDFYMVSRRKSASHTISLCFFSFFFFVFLFRTTMRRLFLSFITKITIIIWRLHATLTTEQITKHGTKLNGKEEGTSCPCLCKITM